jgi:hypothetical protein
MEIHKKTKTTAKLKGKQSSIGAVWDQFLSFATFPTPLIFRYRLPLRLGGAQNIDCFAEISDFM